MRSTTQVVLPISGITADIIDSWTFGEREKISNATKASARMNVDTRIVSFDGGEQSDDRVAMILAIKKFVGKDGLEITVTSQVIDDLDYRDGNALLEAVNAIGKNEKKA